jgi:hypothetical protein
LDCRPPAIGAPTTAIPAASDRNACRVHNQPEQPQICIHYNPYQCWYKRVLTRSVSPEFVRLDRHRLARVLLHFVFDEDGAIVEGPDFATLVDEIAALPPAPPTRASDPPAEDEPTRRWKDDGADRRPPADPPADPAATYSYTG